MALAPNNRGWLLAALIAIPLLIVASCAGCMGFGFAINEYSPRPEISEAEGAVILHVAEVAEVLEHPPGEVTVVRSDRIDVMGILPRLDVKEALGTLMVTTDLRAEADVDRAERRLSTFPYVLAAMVDSEDLGPLPFVGLEHRWLTWTDEGRATTALAVVNGDVHVKWEIAGAEIRDPERMQTLLQDELEAFIALPW